MNAPGPADRTDDSPIPNGAGAAALLAAGVGAFALGVLDVAADHAQGIKRGLSFYTPTGALSGTTTVAILIWILAWVLLNWRWRSRNIAIKVVTWAALALLGLGAILTFPTVVDLF
jgi:hypothetical protein